MEFNQQKSEFLASQIEAIKIHLHLIDEDYLQSLAKAFAERSSVQDAMSVLNPSYDFNRSKLLNTQAKAMNHLHQFIVLLKECDHLKRQIERQKLTASNIDKLFV